MPVRHLTPTSDPLKVAEKIVQAHPNLLAPHLVSTSQVERLIRKLVEQQKRDAMLGAADKPASSEAAAALASAPAAPAAPSASAPSGSSAPGGLQWSERDLNKASDEEVQAAKASMTLDFEKHALRPGDTAYVHDKRVEVPPEDELEDNDWDDEMESCVLDDEPSLKDMLRELEATEIQ